MENPEKFYPIYRDGKWITSREQLLEMRRENDAEREDGIVEVNEVTPAATKYLFLCFGVCAVIYLLWGALV